MSEHDTIKGIQPEREPQEHINLVRDTVLGMEGVYALRIKGNDFADALLSDGDIVVLQRVPPAIVKDGEQVLVKVDGRLMVRDIYQDHKRVTLCPPDPSRPAVSRLAVDVEIQGRVLRVIRRVVKMGDKLPPPTTTPAPTSSTGWQRGSQPQGARLITEGDTSAEGKAAKRVTRKVGRGSAALGRE